MEVILTLWHGVASIQLNCLSFQVLQDHVKAFPASGLVITDHRYNLNSDKADKLVFIM